MEVRDGKQMAREEWRKTERETDLGLECGWDPRRGKQRCMSFGSKISSREDSLTLEYHKAPTGDEQFSVLNYKEKAQRGQANWQQPPWA